MRSAVADAAPELLALACELVGEDPFARIDDGTRFAQPAIFCASLAAWEDAGRPAAGAVAGHSLGELAALVAGGALDTQAGLRIAVLRGYLMQRAADEAGEGGMLALLGDGGVARELARGHGLTIANDNAPTQLVVSGPEAKLDEARREARATGLRALRLPVRGAFHSLDMGSAAGALKRALRQVSFQPTHTPVISCATAAEFSDPRRELAEALVRPVRWRETMARLRQRGVEEFVELGPGRVLTGLVERNPPEGVAPKEAVGA